MENKFIKLIISDYYFYPYNNIKSDLENYIYLKIRENNIIRWDLKNALTTNANGEYIT
jgi:hypothetical protein